MAGKVGLVDEMGADEASATCEENPHDIGFLDGECRWMEGQYCDASLLISDSEMNA